MSAPGIVQNLYVQQGNLQVALQWDILAGATSYIIQRSLDGVNFTQIATPAINNYTDAAVSTGVSYWYQVAGANLNSAQASATVTFTGQPNNNDTITVANVVFTAKTSGATGNQFNIGGTVAQTIINLSLALNSSPSLLNIVLSAPTSATVLTLTAFLAGPEGNGLQISSALTNTTLIPFNGGNAGGVGPFTPPQQVVPAPNAELSLFEIRQRAKQRADRVNSQFVTQPEWNFFIMQAMYELYDLLIDQYEDYFCAPEIVFLSNGTSYYYPLPDGVLSFTNSETNQPVIAPPFYKLSGVDLGLNNANNAYVTVNKYNLIDRNRFVYPNTASTIYGVFNLQYRLMGNRIRFIPTPSANQPIRLIYMPRLPQLIHDTDLTTIGFSGWLQYCIVRAAKYALDKEESDTTSLDEELLYLKTRIEESAVNRDAGQPDRISDTRNNYQNDGSWSGNNGANGGY